MKTMILASLLSFLPMLAHADFRGENRPMNNGGGYGGNGGGHGGNGGGYGGNGGGHGGNGGGYGGNGGGYGGNGGGYGGNGGGYGGNGGGYGGNGAACSQAQQSLATYTAAMATAQEAYSNEYRNCGGNPACMQAIERVYAQTLSGLQSAQAQVSRACR